MKWYIVINLLAYIGASGIIYFVWRCFSEWYEKLENKGITNFKYYIAKSLTYLFTVITIGLAVPCAFWAVDGYLIKKSIVRHEKLPIREREELNRYYDK